MTKIVRAGAVLAGLLVALFALTAPAGAQPYTGTSVSVSRTTWSAARTSPAPVSGWAPGIPVSLTVQSTPVSLPPVTPDSTGSFTVEFASPAEPGPHTLTATQVVDGATITRVTEFTCRDAVQRYRDAGHPRRRAALHRRRQRPDRPDRASPCSPSARWSCCGAQAQRRQRLIARHDRLAADAGASSARWHLEPRTPRRTSSPASLRPLMTGPSDAHPRRWTRRVVVVSLALVAAACTSGGQDSTGEPDRRGLTAPDRVCRPAPSTPPTATSSSGVELDDEASTWATSGSTSTAAT